jgi:hypothetical protein
VIHEQTGNVIDIHTHAGCEFGGNHGTRIDIPDLVATISFVTKSCTLDSDCNDNICQNGEAYIFFL